VHSNAFKDDVQAFGKILQDLFKEQISQSENQDSTSLSTDSEMK